MPRCMWGEEQRSPGARPRVRMRLSRPSVRALARRPIEHPPRPKLRVHSTFFTTGTNGSHDDLWGQRWLGLGLRSLERDLVAATTRWRHRNLDVRKLVVLPTASLPR